MTEYPENPVSAQFMPTLRLLPTRQHHEMAADRLPTGNQRDPRIWAIVLLRFPARPHVIGQFRNRQDAEDQLRALRRLMPQGDFELMFLPPDEADNG